MVDRTPFDPPDPEANVVAEDPGPGGYLDPKERVRRAFQQLRIDDRRLDSPMNWLTQSEVFPSPFDPYATRYRTPTELVGTYPPEDLPSVRDLYKPLAVALGIRHVALVGEPYGPHYGEEKKPRREAEVK